MTSLAQFTFTLQYLSPVCFVMHPDRTDPAAVADKTVQRTLGELDLGTLARRVVDIVPSEKLCKLSFCISPQARYTVLVGSSGETKELVRIGA